MRYDVVYLLLFIYINSNIGGLQGAFTMSCEWRVGKIIFTEIVCDLQIYESNFNRFACSLLVLTALKIKIITLLPYWALDFVAP